MLLRLAAASLLLAHAPTPTALAEGESGIVPAQTALALVENAGQWDTPAVLVGQLGGIRAELLPGAVQLRLLEPEGESSLELRLTLEGASEQCLPRGAGLRPESRSFYTGSDPSLWRACVRSWSAALYEDLVPGVDLRLREAGGRLEWDLLIDAGVRAEDLVMVCRGADDLVLGEGGELVLETALGPVRMGLPTSWSIDAQGSLRPLATAYRRIDSQRFGFELQGRDEDHAVVIDPGIEWATYLGGSGLDVAARIERGPDGRVYVVGVTASPDYPVAGGPPPGTLDDKNCSLSVFDSTGSTLLHSTYFGGSKNEGIYDLDFGPAGEVVATGWTNSSNFPIVPGALQAVKGFSHDGFVVRFDADITVLEYSTYMGDAAGNGQDDWVSAIEVDSNGDWVLCGYTRSPSFPTTLGAYDTTFNGLTDVFVARIRPLGSGAMNLMWSTLLGGSGTEGIGNPGGGGGPYALDLKLDPNGNPTVTGPTRSMDFPVTPGAYQTILKGPSDGFVARFLADGSGLEFSTLFGGSERDIPRSISVDATGRSIVSGWTASSNFPTPNGFDTMLGQAFASTTPPIPGGLGSLFGVSDIDAFVVILSPAGDKLAYGTYLGGSQRDEAYAHVVDANGVISIGGWTASTEFPTRACFPQVAHGGSIDGFVVQLDPSLQPPSEQLLYSTLIGGKYLDEVLDLEFGPNGSLLACGYTESNNFPVTPGAYDSTANGDWDGMALSLQPTYGCPTVSSSYCTAGVSASGCEAILSAAGTASATATSGFDLLATGVEGAKDGLYFFGTNGRQANPWGNGTSLQCVVPPVKRAGLLSGVGALNACNGSFDQDLNALWCPTCPKPFHNPGAGAVVQAQLWYRDPFNTSNQTTSLSNAIEFAVDP